MNKKNVLWVVLDSLFIIIFLLFFFLLGNKEAGRPASVWISFVFVLLAYGMLIVSPYLIKQGKSKAVFGYSLYAISSAYFIIELLVGVIFIFALKPDDWKTAFLLQITLFAIYAVILIVNMLANERTAEAEEERRSQIEYIKFATARVEGMLEKIENKELKKKVEMVYDALDASPVKSHQSLAQAEADILSSIDRLEEKVMAEQEDDVSDLAIALLSAVNDRNRKLKALRQ